MRKTLEAFFHGNIRPSDNLMAPNSELQRAVDKAARCEKRLTEQLGESEKAILTELIRAQHDIDSNVELFAWMLQDVADDGT